MRLTCLYLLTGLSFLGCDNLIKVDVDCPKLCLSSPGPTLPGFANYVPAGVLAAFDGAIPTLGQIALDAGIPGLDGASIGQPPLAVEWVAELDFNQVLKQLPTTAIHLSANVQVSTVNLTSTANLSFIDTVDVFLGRDGTTAGAGNATPGQGGALLDAGSPTPLACSTSGPSMRIASFQRQQNLASGSSIDMVLLNPELNLFDCMKDAPSRFDVKMTILPTAYPAADVPLTLGSCIGVQTHTSYP